jgi:hypothetical protein
MPLAKPVPSGSMDTALTSSPAADTLIGQVFVKPDGLKVKPKNAQAEG